MRHHRNSPRPYPYTWRASEVKILTFNGKVYRGTHLFYGRRSPCLIIRLNAYSSMGLPLSKIASVRAKKTGWLSGGWKSLPVATEQHWRNLGPSS